jgi:hypothetical protein
MMRRFVFWLATRYFNKSIEPLPKGWGCDKFGPYYEVPEKWNGDLHS